MADSKGPTHVTAKFIAVDGHLRIDDQMRFSAQFRKMSPGDGEVFYGRFEREADARKRHREKWYFGFIVAQVIEYTGETAKWQDEHFRALFLPPDCKTYSDMNDQQAGDYNLHCEQYAAEVIGVVIEGPNEARTWTA